MVYKSNEKMRNLPIYRFGCCFVCFDIVRNGYNILQLFLPKVFHNVLTFKMPRKDPLITLSLTFIIQSVDKLIQILMISVWYKVGEIHSVIFVQQFVRKRESVVE